MNRSSPARVIAFSPQPSVADLLKRVLDGAGFAGCAVWSTPDDLEAEVRCTRPDAILYEVGVPFVEHWRALLEVRERAALRAVPIVIATAAPHELYRRVGVSDALEIFTRPSDPTGVRTAVRAAIEAAAPQSRCVTNRRAQID